MPTCPHARRLDLAAPRQPPPPPLRPLRSCREAPFVKGTGGVHLSYDSLFAYKASPPSRQVRDRVWGREGVSVYWCGERPWRAPPPVLVSCILHPASVPASMTPPHRQSSCHNPTPTHHTHMPGYNFAPPLFCIGSA